MYTHRLADRCISNPKWVDEFLANVRKNPNSCQEVWLCSYYGYPPIAKHKELAKTLAKVAKKFEDEGIKVCLQISNTIGHRPCADTIDCTGLVYEGSSANYIVRGDGNVLGEFFCSESEEFQKYTYDEICAYLEEYHYDSIWVDDDLRMGNHYQTCFCEGCLEKFAKRVGKKYTREELAKALQDDYDVRDAWVKFSYDRLYDFSKVIAQAVKDTDPNAVLSLQNGSNGYLGGCGQNAIFNAFYDVTGIAPYYRPGGGSYDDHDPNTFFTKYMYLMHSLRYKPDYVVEVRPEVENLPDVVYGKSPMGQMYETVFFMAAVGATAMTYATMMRRYEPLSTLCEQLPPMTKNFDYMTRLSNINKETFQDGPEYYISEKPWHRRTAADWEWEQIDFKVGREMMRLGFPATMFKTNGVKLLMGHYAESLSDEEIEMLLKTGVVVDGSAAKVLVERGYGKDIGLEDIELMTPVETTGYFEFFGEKYWDSSFFNKIGYRLTLTDKKSEYSHYVRKLDREEGGSASALITTSKGGKWAIFGYSYPYDGISFDKRNHIVDAVEWAGGLLPAKVLSHIQMMVFVRSDKNGVRAVNLLNPTVGVSGEFKVFIRGGVKSAEFVELHGVPKPVKLEKTDGGVIATVENLNAWSIGTIFVK